MTPEEREELLAGYALGSLSTPDAMDADRLVRSDLGAEAELRAYREIADLIALSVPLRQADPALKERVLTAARRGQVWRPARRRRYLPVAGLAAGLMIVTVWAVSLQSSVMQLHRQTQQLSAIVEADAKRLDRLGDPIAPGVQQANTLGVQLQTTASDQQVLIAVQTDRAAVLGQFDTTAASHGASGQYVWSGTADAGVVTVRDLPQLPLGGTYRVWLEDGLSRLMVARSFAPDRNGKAEVVLQAEGRIKPVRIYVVAASRADDPRSTGPVVLLADLTRAAPSSTAVP